MTGPAPPAPLAVPLSQQLNLFRDAAGLDEMSFADAPWSALGDISVTLQPYSPPSPPTGPYKMTAVARPSVQWSLPAHDEAQALVVTNIAIVLAYDGATYDIEGTGQLLLPIFPTGPMFQAPVKIDFGGSTGSGSQEPPPKSFTADIAAYTFGNFLDWVGVDLYDGNRMSQNLPCPVDLFTPKSLAGLVSNPPPSSVKLTIEPHSEHTDVKFSQTFANASMTLPPEYLCVFSFLSMDCHSYPRGFNSPVHRDLGAGEGVKNFLR